MTRYRNRHVSQYAAGNSTVTKRTGCTWCSGTNGLDASTGGKVQRTPDQVHALVPSSQETNPAYPGWSIADLDHAMAKLDVPFTNRSGHGWAEVNAQRASGRYLAVQGDSDRFGNNTCSGAYDGDHCIGVHPDTKTDPDGTIWWWINDPICPSGRWERDTVIRAYAEKLSRSIYFGSFDVPVPQLVKPWRAVVHPKIGWFLAYTVTAGKITAMRRVTTDGFSAPCTAPKRYPFTNGGSRALVRLTAGAYKGLYIGSIWAAEVEA